jgi:ATP-dependent helicase/nuclease subunit A
MPRDSATTFSDPSPDECEPPLAKQTLKTMLFRDPSPDECEPPLADAADKTPASARIGLAMHRLLQWGAVTDVNQQAVAREFALAAQEAEQAACTALRILQGEGAWAWDSQALIWQGNEVELVYQGQTLRLDRLVLRRASGPDRAATWWVLDYKSAPAPQTQAALCAQLQKYRAAVQAAYPQDPVKGAFLTAQGAWIEVDDAPLA